MPGLRSPAVGYGLAAAVIVAVTKVVIDPFLEAQSPFLLFALAVMVVAGLGGLGPGLFATVLALVVKPRAGNRRTEPAEASRVPPDRVGPFYFPGVGLARCPEPGRAKTSCTPRVYPRLQTYGITVSSAKDADSSCSTSAVKSFRVVRLRKTARRRP